MRKLLTLLACSALTGCGAAAPLPTFSEISTRNSGVPIRQLLAEQRPADALAEPVAVLQTMTEPTSTAKISFAIENGLLLAVDPALGDPILAVQNHDANMIVLRDLGPVYSSAAKRRGVLRRLLEEELQHANDTAIFYRAMPEASEDSPEEIVVSMMLEAHARASIADAFAQHLASGSVADFHIEPALCDARKLTAFLADNPEQRRAAARDITLGFMRGRGKFYAAFEQERLGDERFRRALRDEELVRRVFAAAGDIFILADDDRRYVDEADVIAGLRSMIDGPGTQLAQGELFLTKLLPSSSGVSPCPIKVIDGEEQTLPRCP